MADQDNGTQPGNDAHGSGATDATGSARAAGGKQSVLHKLYVGTGAFDIVGKRKRWYVLFGVVIAICVAAIGIRGFNFGIDFEGGTQIQFPAQSTQGTISTDAAQEVFADVVGSEPSQVQTVGTGAATSVQVRSETLEPDQVTALKQSFFERLQPVGSSGEPSTNAISVSEVSATWGAEISEKAGIALGVFLVLVTIFLTLYFERWMAFAALLALLNDIVVTAGVYALVGLKVTPATTIGLLTILGFSLYDTVVVFDKVRENTRGLLGLTRRTYGEAANLALNQTLMRSINTSIIAVLPVLGLLVIGYVLLGAGTLQELALVQLVGMIAGVFSSVLLATPVLVAGKMRNPKYREQAERVYARRANLRYKPVVSGEGNIDADDDGELASELRKEKALAAAASVPARTPKSNPTRQGRPTGKRKR